MTRTEVSLPKRVVASKLAFAAAAFSGASSHCLKAAARMALGKRNTGARVMPCCKTAADAPPDSVMALQPRRVDAISVPSTVAIGTWYELPLSSSGPATPTGSGT